MTDTAHQPALPRRMPDAMLQARGGLREVGRVAQRFSGVSLSVAALTLLLLPVGGGEPAAALSKVMVVLVLGFAGIALWQAGSPRPAPDLEIDVARRELRLVRRGRAGAAQLVRCRFADLARAQVRDRRVRFWDARDQLLAEVILPDAGSIGLLQRALLDEGVAV